MFDHKNKYAGLGEAVFIVSCVTSIVLFILSGYFFGETVTIVGLLIIVFAIGGLMSIWYTTPWILWAYYTVFVYIFNKVKDKWFQKKLM